MSDPYPPIIFSLPDGLQVVAVHRPWSKLGSAVLIYRAGTFDDPKNAPGTAHFVEHLAFAVENKPLVAQIGTLGTQVSAETWYDGTRFASTGHVDDFDQSLKFIAAIMRNRPVAADDIAGERKVFDHELQDEKNQTRRDLQIGRFWRRALGAPHWRNGQTKQYVRTKRFTPERINEFKNKYYRSSNARLAIVTPLSHEELRRRVDTHLALDGGAELDPEPRPAAVSHVPPLIVTYDLNTYIWIDVLHRVRSTDLITRLTANLIGHLFGGGPHSELFQKFRIERGLAYHIGAYDWPYLSCTAMNCFLSVRKRSFDEVLSYIVHRLDEIASNGISSEQLQQEKQRLIRWHEVATDYASGLAGYLAYESFRSNDSALQQPDFYRRTVAELTLDQVNQAASELLSKQNRAVFVAGRIGPITRMQIRRRLRGK